MMLLRLHIAKVDTNVRRMQTPLIIITRQPRINIWSLIAGCDLIETSLSIYTTSSLLEFPAMYHELHERSLLLRTSRPFFRSRNPSDHLRLVSLPYREPRARASFRSVYSRDKLSVHVVSRAVTDTCYPTMRRCKDLVFSDTWGGGGSGKSKVLATMATFLARAGFHVLATAPAYTTTNRLLETIKAPG